jgi:hypothetical protein
MLIFRVMTLILVILYFITSIAFIPLFISIIVKLSKSYNKIYKFLRLKLWIMFILFEIFLIVRLWIYIDINYTHWAFSDQITIKTETPFYCTEVILTALMSYILFSVSKLQQDNASYLINNSNESDVSA